jgi:hypothetical protein
MFNANSILGIPSFNAFGFCRTVIFNDFGNTGYDFGTRGLIDWLVFGKIGENPVVTPTSSTQVITPTAVNRYLESVTVNPIPTTPTP